MALLVVVATSLWDAGPITRGLAAALVTCALILSLENSRGGLVKRALSSDLVVYLGRVSYGTYLWHWPIILVAMRTFKLSGVATAAVAVLLASGVASLSYQVLERPYGRRVSSTPIGAW